MNNFTGVGRLTRDPELRQTSGNVSVCSFTIAINRRFKNANGEYDADFLSCVAWRHTGEFVAKYFRKGNMIGVVGSVQTRNWYDTEGKRHYSTEVIVEQAHFCGSKVDGANQTSQTPQEVASAGFFPGSDDDTALPFDI
jgi:single-strand DNA-binding protein